MKPLLQYPIPCVTWLPPCRPYPHDSLYQNFLSSFRTRWKIVLCKICACRISFLLLPPPQIVSLCILAFLILAGSSPSRAFRIGFDSSSSFSLSHVHVHVHPTRWVPSHLFTVHPLLAIYHTTTAHYFMTIPSVFFVSFSCYLLALVHNNVTSRLP